MRIFPNPTKDEQVAFAYHSTRIERIAVQKDDINQTLSGAIPTIDRNNKDPSAHFHRIYAFHALSGQFKCLNLIKEFAANENLIPPANQVHEHNTLNHLSFLLRLHKNLMTQIAEFGYNLNDHNFIHPSQVGRWREERHWCADKEMPTPFSIKSNLHNMLKDLAEFHDQYRSKIEMPQNLTQQDIENLVNKSYEINLKICCIKPFKDGSNRIARLVENAIRLNWGLPFKIIKSDDDSKWDYMQDIKRMQSLY